MLTRSLLTKASTFKRMKQKCVVDLAQSSKCNAGALTNQSGTDRAKNGTLQRILNCKGWGKALFFWQHPNRGRIMLDLLKNLWSSGTRERRPRRVAVIDAAPVDRSRSVVLVRRDNIEHLVLIGGHGDVVIESKIPRSAARVPGRPVRPGAPRLGQEPGQEPGQESSRELPPSPLRGAVPGVSAPKLTPPPEPTPRHALEELKRQLEVALNGTPAQQGRPPVTDPFAFPRPTDSASSGGQQDKGNLELIEPRATEPGADAKPEPESEPGVARKFEPPAKSELRPEEKLKQPPSPQPEDEPAQQGGAKASDI